MKKIRIFKSKSFYQWAKFENLKDTMLVKAICEMEKEAYEANLGSGLYKKRIAMSGKGKSGSY